MSALTRTDPFDALLPEMWRRFGLAAPQRGMPAEMKLDVTENDKEYLVRAEIPGARKEDIHVSVEGNFVSLSAEVRQEKEEASGGRVLLKETTVGSVSRGFSLAHEIDDQRVQAKLEDGILRLTLPKRENTGRRRITVE
jgi:HSP20 family protein